MSASTPTVPNLALIPAASAPPGQVSNLVDPYSQEPIMIAVIVLCLVFLVPMVIIRTFTKTYVMRSMQIEDYSLILATIGVIIWCGGALLADNVGEGKHLWDVSLADAMQLAMRANYLTAIYPPIMFFAKFAVLKQQERIFTTARKDWVYWTIQAMIYLNLAFNIGGMIAILCQCIPREKIANPTIPGICINDNAAIMFSCVINVISDWAILILPAVVIGRLQLRTKQKIGIAAIFAVGLLACIASLCRMVYSVYWINTPGDVSWVTEIVAIWVIVELTTVCLAACGPSLPRFIKFVKFGRRGETTGYPTGQTAESMNRHRSWTKRSYQMHSMTKDSQLGADDHEKLHSVPEASYDPTDSPIEPRDASHVQLPSGINKTVQIQTTYSRYAS